MEPLASISNSKSCGSIFVEADHNFGVTISALVELRIGIWGLLDVDAMAHNQAWLGGSADSQVAQIFVVFLYRSLTGSDCYAFFEELCQWKGKDSLLPLLVTRAGIRGDIDPNNAVR